MATRADERKTGDTANRGFASMDDDKQREIASKGGHSVRPEDRSFAKDHGLAAEAGRKGGEHSHGGRNAGDDDRGGSGRGGNFAQDREKAAEAGRKGARA
jgi:general stress protein YciG